MELPRALTPVIITIDNWSAPADAALGLVVEGEILSEGGWCGKIDAAFRQVCLDHKIPGVETGKEIMVLWGTRAPIGRNPPRVIIRVEVLEVSSNVPDRQTLTGLAMNLVVVMREKGDPKTFVEVRVTRTSASADVAILN